MLITKLEAARRQIDTAIDLYFHGGDELATHTLVGAAHILVTDLSKAAGLQSVIDRHIVPAWRSKFEKAIRAPQNFMKHADRDAAETLDFNPHNTELMLFIDIEMFKELTESATDRMRTFHVYAGSTFARASFERFDQGVLEDFTTDAASMSKLDFFRSVMNLIERGRASGAVK